MEIKDIILYILVIIVIYLIYKTRKSENFSSPTIKADIIAEVNNKYKIDMDAMRNLSNISKRILAAGDTLEIPAKLTKTSDAYINGTLGVANVATFYNSIDIPYRNTSLLNIFPSHMIIMWPKVIPPKGWAICNGKRYKINAEGITYETLEPEKISTDGKQTVIVLQTPDLQGRCVIGAGLGSSRNTDNTDSGAVVSKLLGTRGGQETVKLKIAEMPSHTHDHNIWRSGNDDCGNGNVFDCGNGGNKSSVVIEATGGNQPHDNMQPWYALNFIMKF